MILYIRSLPVPQLGISSYIPVKHCSMASVLLIIAKFLLSSMHYRRFLWWELSCYSLEHLPSHFCSPFLSICRYEYYYALLRDFPDLKFTINGGILSVDEVYSWEANLANLVLYFSQFSHSSNPLVHNHKKPFLYNFGSGKLRIKRRSSWCNGGTCCISQVCMNTDVSV